MLNKAMLIGNLGQDPETRYTQDGTCVCNIRLATTERFKELLRAGQTGFSVALDLPTQLGLDSAALAGGANALREH